jgi:hypothetical protein
METQLNPSMTTDSVKNIADAVLYEGFMLYPYRRSSLKNQQRWNFGVLFPPAYCERKQSGESSTMQTECLFEKEESARLSIQVRFLQLCDHETVEREVSDSVSIAELSVASRKFPFCFSNLSGTLEFSSTLLEGKDYKLTVRVANVTEWDGEDRENALRGALISTHILMKLENGSFYSLIDAPPELARKANCQNVGSWPVLVGEEGQRDRMLAAPIILYDYPKIASQSMGDMFDGTEIDEILNLRIKTLSDDEKRDLQHDERTAELLKRAEQLDKTQLASLHGALYRGKHAKTSLKAGDHVVLRPKRQSDILDLALAGRSATVSSMEIDFEDNVYVCVTVDDDPGKDLGLQGEPGHRFFFGLDEVEVI